MKGYFHTDDERTLMWLENVFATARANKWPVRLFTDNGTLKVKVNHGVWTVPMRSTPDTYRDAPLDWEQKVLTNDEQSRMCIPKTIGGIPRVDA